MSSQPVNATKPRLRKNQLHHCKASMRICLVASRPQSVASDSQEHFPALGPPSWLQHIPRAECVSRGPTGWAEQESTNPTPIPAN